MVIGVPILEHHRVVELHKTDSDMWSYSKRGNPHLITE